MAGLVKYFILRELFCCNTQIFLIFIAIFVAQQTFIVCHELSATLVRYSTWQNQSTPHFIRSFLFSFFLQLCHFISLTALGLSCFRFIRDNLERGYLHECDFSAQVIEFLYFLFLYANVYITFRRSWVIAVLKWSFTPFEMLRTAHNR